MLTASPPGNLGVGQLYVGSLCSLMETPPAVVALLQRDEFVPDEVGVQASMLVRRRFEPAYRRLPGWLGDLLAAAAVRSKLIPRVRSLIPAIAGFARDCRSNALLAVMDCPTSMLLAAPLSRELGIPLHCLVWDMPDYLLEKLGHRGAGADPILAAFADAIRSSLSVTVMSEAMQSEMRSDYGKDAEILRQPIDPAWHPSSPEPDPPQSDFVIGFAGSVSAKAEIENLLEALDLVDWKLCGRRVRFRVFGLRFICQAKSPRWIEFRGYQPAVADVVAGLTACDLLYLPQPFGELNARFSRYSFPTKLSTYLAAKRPILACAPQDGSLSRFFEANRLSYVVNSDTRESLTHALKRIASDPAGREESAAQLLQVVQDQFGVERARRILASQLDRKFN